MKLYYIWILSIFATMGTQAQNTIAKIKYEQAEEAYANGDYSTALIKINKVEEMLKSSNPKTLYLKIMAQEKLLETDYSVIKNLKKDLDSYIAKYESVSELEDKFREVYEVYERVSKMDDSQDAINKILQEKEAAIALKEKEAKGLEALFAYVKKVEAEHNLFIGITWSQFAQKNPIAAQNSYKTYNNGNYWGINTVSYVQKSDPFDCQVGGMTGPDGNLVYASHAFECGKKQWDSHLTIYNSIKQEIYSLIPSTYIKETQNSYGTVGIIITIPKTDNSPQYYLRYSLGSYNNKSSVSVSVGTVEKIMHY